MIMFYNTKAAEDSAEENNIGSNEQNEQKSKLHIKINMLIKII